LTIGFINRNHGGNQSAFSGQTANMRPVNFLTLIKEAEMNLINTQVQPFKANAFHNGKFIEVTEQSLKGQWSVLIFMPAAFTFNCPTEIEDAANNYAEFQKAGTEVYIVTTDTHFSHKVWHETSPAVGTAKFPLIGDPTHALTNAFGVHIAEEGLAPQ
jgi:peroxiredoxin (alkyl hydroperoxide reductase subunit C)